MKIDSNFPYGNIYKIFVKKNNFFNKLFFLTYILYVEFIEYFLYYFAYFEFIKEIIFF